MTRSEVFLLASASVLPVVALGVLGYGHWRRPLGPGEVGARLPLEEYEPDNVSPQSTAGLVPGSSTGGVNQA